MSSFVEKFKGFWSPGDSEYDGYDEYEYDYDDDEYDQEDQESEDRNVYSKRRSSSRRSGRDSARSSDYDAPDQYAQNKVVNINATAKLQVVLFRPERFGEETREIADELMKTHTVVLNLEDANRDMSRRIIDFLSGVTYANKGKIRKIATNTFLIIPSNVDLTGDDLIDELESNGMIFG